MLKIEFNNKDKSPIKKNFLEKIARKTIARSGIFDSDLTPSSSPCLAGRRAYKEKGDLRVSISFAAVSEEEMRKLNRVYRKKKSPTDVLSFAEFKNKEEIKRVLQRRDALAEHLCQDANEDYASLFLGEIILCYNNIAKYSKKNKLNLEREFSKVVSHGVLHLLGFQHGKRMFEIQNRTSN